LGKNFVFQERSNPAQHCFQQTDGPRGGGGYFNVEISQTMVKYFVKNFLGPPPKKKLLLVPKAQIFFFLKLGKM
jgi:hypothetical protein